MHQKTLRKLLQGIPHLYLGIQMSQKHLPAIWCGWILGTDKIIRTRSSLVLCFLPPKAEQVMPAATPVDHVEDSEEAAAVGETCHRTKETSFPVLALTLVVRYISPKVKLQKGMMLLPPEKLRAGQAIIEDTVGRLQRRKHMLRQAAPSFQCREKWLRVPAERSRID